MRHPTLLSALLILPLAACEPNAGTEASELEPEKLKGIYAMSDGSTLLYETTKDDGGVPFLEVDYMIPLFDEVHIGFTYPVTVVTRDEDGNEIERRVLEDIDAVAEDDVFVAAAWRSEFVQKLAVDPSDSIALVGIGLWEYVIEDPETPEEELPLFIATIRDLAVEEGEES